MSSDDLRTGYDQHSPHASNLRWDIFCRVVDNFGDIGVCWRLARQLASAYGMQVCLWVDDLPSFACLNPSLSAEASEQRLGPIIVRHWSSAFPTVEVADVVIEAFACKLPETYVAAMSSRSRPPVWINLEYLTAEDWIEDCHQLRSPHPGSSLSKYFFFPGFTSKTGGLLLGKDLLAERIAFDSVAVEKFWQSLGIPLPAQQELRISLFCYNNLSLFELLQVWADGSIPIRLLVAPGAATEQVSQWLSQTVFPGTQFQTKSLTVSGLPFLEHSRYDQLLWACDINFVRGEDSFVRAQWAQRPFVWQIYPQDENAHLVKLQAFLMRYLEEIKGKNEALAADAVSKCWLAWNGVGEIRIAWADFMAIRETIEQHAKVWASQLDRTGNLADNLVRFVRGKLIPSTACVAEAS